MKFDRLWYHLQPTLSISWTNDISTCQFSSWSGYGMCQNIIHLRNPEFVKLYGCLQKYLPHR